MKNDNHPIVQAMLSKRGPSTSGSTPFDMMEPSRHLEIKHAELPGLGNVAVGSKVTAMVHGTVRSQHSDGHSMIEIHQIKPDSPAEDKAVNPDFKEPKGNPVVMTQDSHVPS